MKGRSIVLLPISSSATFILTTYNTETQLNNIDTNDICFINLCQLDHNLFDRADRGQDRGHPRLSGGRRSRVRQVTFKVAVLRGHLSHYRANTGRLCFNINLLYRQNT